MYIYVYICTYIYINTFHAYYSPAGEYNLHLGIMKEMRPDMIATNTADVQEVNGHPVLVETAVSLGGRRAKEVRLYAR